MKSKTGISNVIPREEPRTPERKPKTRGAGELVGLGLRVKREVWLALHEQAISHRTNVTQLIVGWLNESRSRDGLPPVG
jgi:hypothetical protein